MTNLANISISPVSDEGEKKGKGKMKILKISINIGIVNCKKKNSREN